MALWQPLIVCSNPPDFPKECDFDALMLLANHLITDLIILSTLFATAAFVYIGIKLLTAGGDKGAMESAKKSFKAVVTGFVVILVAWLLVYTITNALLDPGYSLLGAPK